MSDEYNIERETEFSRDKLRNAIPIKIHELIQSLNSLQVEGWHAELIQKLAKAVERVCADLEKTIEQSDMVSTAAWNARNLLELWVWIKYCKLSRENALRFYEDALRDISGLTDALSKMHVLRNMPNTFESTARAKIAEVAQQHLGLTSIDSDFTRVSDAARTNGDLEWFSENNKFLSKFAHPTAGLIIGLRHQGLLLRNFQATVTTTGVYFAGQCVIELDETISSCQQ